MIAHPYLFSAAVIALMCGMGLRAVLPNYDREGKMFATYLIVSGVIFGVLAFTVN